MKFDSRAAATMTSPAPRRSAIDASLSLADAALLLGLFGAVFFWIHNLGLVGDDFGLLVESLKLPLTRAGDELHRPLRNVVCHLLGSLVGVRQVWPYRLLIALSFTADLALLLALVRRLGTCRASSWFSVVALALFPRNEEVLLWFAAWQDLVAAACVLLACLCFMEYRDSGGFHSLLGGTVAYAVGLGFKETTVVIPALFVVLDLYREGSTASFRKPRFWRPYIPFAVILILYSAYFFADSGSASLSGHRTAGYYGFHDLTQVMAGLIRAVVNIALPFSMLPLGLKELRFHHFALLAVELSLVLLVVWRFRAWSALILAVGWLFCTILPTAAFAAAFNADRYLFVPVLGAAIFVGLLVDMIAKSGHEPKYSAYVWIMLCVYACFASFQMSAFRSLYQKAGDEAALIIRQTVQASSRLPAVGEVDLINVTSFLGPYIVPVFPTSLGGALQGNGLSPTIRILQNSKEDSPKQHTLTSKLQACLGASAFGPGDRIVLIALDGQLRSVDTRCAAPLIDADRSQRPTAWRFADSF